MEVDCFFEKCYIFEGIFLSCIVKAATVLEPNKKIKMIKAVDERRINSVVTAIRFIQSTIWHIPRGLCQYNFNLLVLEINSCGLKSISSEDLDGFEKLKEMWIENNELVSLPSNLFSNMKQLERVSFAKNKLEFITSELLEPIKQSIN